MIFEKLGVHHHSFEMEYFRTQVKLGWSIYKNFEARIQKDYKEKRELSTPNSKAKMIREIVIFSLNKLN